MRYDFVERHRGRWPVRTDVPGPARLPGRLLRLAGKAAERQDAATRGPDRRHQGHPRRGEGPLRQPADPRRAGGPGAPCCVNTVARLMRTRGDRRQDEAEVPLHDRLEPRPPGGRERAGSPVRAGGGEPGLGGRHHLHRDRRGLAVPGGGGGPALAADRGLVDGPSGSTAGWSSTPWRWPWPAAGPARGWWPIRTGAASTPASTTSGCWPATGSPAA